MTTKDYSIIAHAILIATVEQDARARVARSIAAELEEENPHFDRIKFLTACGVSHFVLRKDFEVAT